jgi:hypothetical protein
MPGIKRFDVKKLLAKLISIVILLSYFIENLHYYWFTGHTDPYWGLGG